MTKLTNEHREEIAIEWQGIYPTANEFVAMRGFPQPTLQTPLKVPIPRDYSGMEDFRYCYDFQSLEVSVEDNRRQIDARTYPETSGGTGHRITLGLESGKYNESELIRLESFLAQRIVPVTMGYSVSGRIGSPRMLHYVAIPSLGQGSSFEKFVFE
jgi:hypothetical protein